MLYDEDLNPLQKGTPQSRKTLWGRGAAAERQGGGRCAGAAKELNGRAVQSGTEDIRQESFGSGVSERAGEAWSISDLGKIKYQLRIEDKNRLDILDKQETRLTADIKTLERAYAETIRAEYERSIKPSEETSLRQTPRTGAKPLKLCYNVVCPKERAEIFAKGCGRYGNKSTG